MSINNKVLVSGIVLTVAGASMFATKTTFAQTNSTTDAAQHMQNSDESLVQKIVDKFHLNKSDVQAVFDEQQKEMEAKKSERQDKKLSQLVNDGKLTEDQKQKILDKLKEIQSSRNADREQMKNMTQQERKAAKDNEQTELKAWATENNIPMEYFFMGGKQREFKN